MRTGKLTITWGRKFANFSTFHTWAKQKQQRLQNCATFGQEWQTWCNKNAETVSRVSPTSNLNLHNHRWKKKISLLTQWKRLAQTFSTLTDYAGWLSTIGSATSHLSSNWGKVRQQKWWSPKWRKSSYFADFLKSWNRMTVLVTEGASKVGLSNVAS